MASCGLVADLGRPIAAPQAKKHLSLVIEAIVENYGEYRDYNATTTQSDRGELLYTLLDFLRLKAIYERIHWNLRPVMMVHEVLVRRGRDGAARLWARAMAKETQATADQQLHRLAELQKKYGMRLSTVADRLAEQFLQPLAIDRLRALVRPAIEESRQQLAAACLHGVGGGGGPIGPGADRRRARSARLAGDSGRRSRPRRSAARRIGRRSARFSASAAELGRNSIAIGEMGSPAAGRPRPVSAVMQPEHGAHLCRSLPFSHRLPPPIPHNRHKRKNSRKSYKISNTLTTLGCSRHCAVCA